MAHKYFQESDGAEILAYLAGAIDSDGCIRIKKDTYAVRNHSSVNPAYQEVIHLKQTTPQIPDLLKETFGGSIHLSKGGSANSKPLYAYLASCRIASDIAALLLPYLRVKARQAEILCELRKAKQTPHNKLSYWYELEHPNWREEELLTPKEACAALNYRNAASLSQAVNNGSLLALPYRGKTEPRYPKGLVEQYRSLYGPDGCRRLQAPQLVAWKEQLYQEIRELNKIGINGTSTYWKRSFHKPKEVA